MGADPDPIRRTSTAPRPARQPTGTSADPSTAGSSMSSWVQSARESAGERGNHPRDGGHARVVGGAPASTRPPPAPCGAWCKGCFTHLHVPLVGLLPDRSGTGWFVAAARGVGAKRSRHRPIHRRGECAPAGSIDEEPSRHACRPRDGPRAGRADLRRRIGAARDRPAARINARSCAPPGRCRPSRLANLGEVGWAKIRSDNLDLALACTAHELRGPLVGARAALGHVQIDDQGPMSGELLRRTREELDQLADLVDPLLQWSAGSTVAHPATGRPGPHGRARGRLVPAGVRTRRSGRAGAGGRCWYGPTNNSWSGRSRTWSGTRSRTRRGGSSVTIDVDADDERARVRVRDRGPGVPAAERHLIFDPFARGRAHGRNPRRQGIGAVHRETDRRGARRFHRSSIRPTGDGVQHRAATPGGGRLRSAS